MTNPLHYPDLDKRFEKIILKCQELREKYPFDYEEKAKKWIDKFEKEITEKKLLEKCESRNFAEQLCSKNGLIFNK